MEYVIPLFLGLSVVVEFFPNNKIKLWSWVREYFSKPVKEHIDEEILKITDRMDFIESKTDRSIVQRIKNDIVKYNEEEKRGIKKTELQYDLLLQEYKWYHEELKANGYIDDIIKEIKERREKKKKKETSES